MNRTDFNPLPSFVSNSTTTPGTATRELNAAERNAAARPAANPANDPFAKMLERSRQAPRPSAPEPARRADSPKSPHAADNPKPAEKPGPATPVPRETASPAPSARGATGPEPQRAPREPSERQTNKPSDTAPATDNTAAKAGKAPRRAGSGGLPATPVAKPADPERGPGVARTADDDSAWPTRRAGGAGSDGAVPGGSQAGVGTAQAPVPSALASGQTSAPNTASAQAPLGGSINTPTAGIDAQGAGPTRVEALAVAAQSSRSSREAAAPGTGNGNSTAAVTDNRAEHANGGHRNGRLEDGAAAPDSTPGAPRAAADEARNTPSPQANIGANVGLNAGASTAMAAAVANGAAFTPGAATATSAADTTSTTATNGLVDVTLGTPLQNPAFAPALGSLLTVWARDGVSQARLHLNPAELGPVQVEIRVEGNAAQLVLTAQHPETRQALEQAMPVLASSLREAGLVLSGGGVFDQSQQSPQPRDATGDGGNSRGSDANPEGRGENPHRAANGADTRSADWRPAPLLRQRGVVDLVA